MSRMWMPMPLHWYLFMFLRLVEQAQHSQVLNRSLVQEEELSFSHARCYIPFFWPIVVGLVRLIVIAIAPTRLVNLDFHSRSPFTYESEG